MDMAKYYSHMLQQVCGTVYQSKWVLLLLGKQKKSSSITVSSMPPQRKTRHLDNPPQADMPPVQFAPDITNVTPQQAAGLMAQETFYPSMEMVASIIAAVHMAL